MLKLRTPKLSKAINAFHDSNAGMLSERSDRYYRNCLSYALEFMGDHKLDQLEVQDFDAWRKSLFERRLSTHTVYSYLKAVKRFYRWMDESEYWPNDMDKKIKKPKLPDLDPKAVELADVKLVLGYLAERERHGSEPQALICRDRAIILFLADTGCRVGGLVSLTVGTLDVDCCRAIVVEKGRGGGKRRLIFFGDKTAAALKDWLHYHPLRIRDDELDPSTPVWVSIQETRLASGLSLSITTVGHMLKNRAKRAGINGRFNPHSFRHGAAREWLRNGADLSTVSQLLGHAGVTVTAQHYARWAEEELAEMHKKFGFIGSSENGQREKEAVR